MTPLTDEDEARIRAVIHEMRVNSEDPYLHAMLDELEDTIENAGIDNPADWTPSPQTTEEDWVVSTD